MIHSSFWLTIYLSAFYFFCFFVFDLFFKMKVLQIPLFNLISFFPKCKSLLPPGFSLILQMKVNHGLPFIFYSNFFLNFFPTINNVVLLNTNGIYFFGSFSILSWVLFFCTFFSDWINQLITLYRTQFQPS